MSGDIESQQLFFAFKDLFFIEFRDIRYWNALNFLPVVAVEQFKERHLSALAVAYSGLSVADGRLRDSHKLGTAQSERVERPGADQIFQHS